MTTRRHHSNATSSGHFRPADFCYDVFDAADLWIASAHLYAGDDAADEVQYARAFWGNLRCSRCALLSVALQILARRVIPFSESLDEGRFMGLPTPSQPGAADPLPSSMLLITRPRRPLARPRST